MANDKVITPARIDLWRWCVVQWTVDEWPWVTRCRQSPDHTGDHVDHRGRRLKLSSADTRRARGR